jgi:DNA-binding response OmpR family regulator
MTHPIDILIVEDNYALRESLADYLQGEGFRMRCVDDGEELNTELAKRACDVLVLDLNLPNEDGISIAKRIRNAYPKMGIIILTARIQGVDRTQSYESGADVYLTKPVAPLELKTVLENLGRRIERIEVRSEWVFHPKTFCLTSPNGDAIKFTASENAVFLELAVAGGVLPLYRLIQRFGEIDSSEELNKVRFEKLISRIRAKLKPFSSEEITIQSIYKQGYQLMLPVTVASEP